MNDERARFGVIGLGEVGLPLALAVQRAGYEVVGVDLDRDRVETLQSGESYIRDISDRSVRGALDSDLSVTTDYEQLSSVTHVAVCVPTPLHKSGRPDISYVVDAVQELTTVLTPETTVVVESTVYPGATEGVIADTLSEGGFTIGEGVSLAFSPERIDPGNEKYDLEEIPKVVGGVTPDCLYRVVAVYEDVFDQVVTLNSTTEAEMTKILENTFRNVNIGLVNELAQVSNDLDIDFWNVIEAAKTKPYGFMPF